MPRRLLVDAPQAPVDAPQGAVGCVAQRRLRTSQPRPCREGFDAIFRVNDSPRNRRAAPLRPGAPFA
eukprot:6996581-Alexandrium_andersonii.AAC.1